MHPATRTAIFRRLKAANPVPTTELLHETPFELLVAVMLSAHTTDRSVNAATASCSPWPTRRRLLPWGRGREAYMKTVGLYNAKAANLIGLCQQLMDLHDGQVPANRESLEALPGVGRKTANVVLNIAFGEITIAVDTHIFRVANRTGLAPGVRRWPWRSNWSGPPRAEFARRPTIGCCCMAAMCASPAHPSARAA